MAYTPGDYFSAGTVKIDTADLAMVLVVEDVVAWLADLQVELAVGADTMNFQPCASSFGRSL